MSLFSGFLKSVMYKESTKIKTNIQNDKEKWIRDTYAVWMQLNFKSFEYICEGPYDKAIESRQRFLLSRDWGIKSKQDCIRMAEDLCTRNGDKNDLSWNLCRVMQIYGMGFCADYFTREEMIEKSSKVAIQMQQSFSSWDDLIKSYLKGYENWVSYVSPENAKEFIEIRYQAYNEVQASTIKAYTVNWNYNFYN